MVFRPLPIRPGGLAGLTLALSGLLGVVVLTGLPAEASPNTVGGATSAIHASMMIPKVVATRREVAQATPVVAAGDALGTWESRMAATYPNTYGGVYVDSAGHFVVPTVGSASPLRQWARRSFSGVAREYLSAGGANAGSTLRAADTGSPPSLTFTAATTSFDALVQLKADILANTALMVDGVLGAGIDVENDAVSVTTSGGPVDAALEAVYGSEVEVTDATGTTFDASRTKDVAPWNGGDMILTTSGWLCSLGFGLYDEATGTTYQLTAGHCGSASWYNLPRTGTTFTSAHLVGSTVSGSAVTSGIDAQLITSNSSCISWGASGSRYFITGYANAPQGATVDAEGAVGGSIAGTVAVYDWSGDFGSENLSNVDLTTAVTSLGDSGGPLVYPTGYGPLAAGSIIGTITYSNGTTYGAVQNIDAEIWDYSAFIGDSIGVNTSSNGTSC
ncbi:MAG: hypothetical protein ACLQK4_11940 [Acidimicrobiales bacterium]|jgi:hypothetical protein